jgi:hypothetical protein
MVIEPGAPGESVQVLGTRLVTDIPKPTLSIPRWMLGKWAIQGSTQFKGVSISTGKFRFDLGHSQFEMDDARAIVQSAKTSLGDSRLLIHVGPPGWSDSDSDYEGSIVVLRRSTDSAQGEVVLAWQYKAQCTSYGIGPYTPDPGTWILTRIAP